MLSLARPRAPSSLRACQRQGRPALSPGRKAHGRIWYEPVLAQARQQMRQQARAWLAELEGWQTEGLPVPAALLAEARGRIRGRGNY